MISPTAEYALRAVVALANAAPEPRTAKQLAADTKVPRPYLSKILQSLVRAGLLTSQRGVGGGFRLGRDLERVTLLDIVQAVDPLERIRECPLGLAGHGPNLCPLHRTLDAAFAEIERRFAETTLASLLRERRKSGQCPFPLVPRDGAGGDGRPTDGGR